MLAPGERRRQSRKVDLGSARESPGSSSQEADACDDHQTSNIGTAGPEAAAALIRRNQAEKSAATAVADVTLANSKGEDGATASWNIAALNGSDSSILSEIGPFIGDTSILEGGQLVGLDNTTVRGPSSTQSLSTVDPRALFGSASPSPSPSSATPIDYSFPYSYTLPVNELTLFRGFLRIAARLGCQNNLWDINAHSPFSDPASSISHLPQTWQPTTAQILIPHHPILDLLPWPSVRENIIRVLTLPEEVRPPIAKSATALVQFVYDLKDNAEGIRIWGGDTYDPASWEVGQLLFERWWFIFDREIVAQSNMWRDLRGAARLRISRPDETSR